MLSFDGGKSRIPNRNLPSNIATFGNQPSDCSGVVEDGLFTGAREASAPLPDAKARP
jgi:hypothetical protein